MDVDMDMDMDSWSLVPGYWSLVPGSGPGPWSLVPSPWSWSLVLVPDPVSLVLGPWSWFWSLPGRTWTWIWIWTRAWAETWTSTGMIINLATPTVMGIRTDRFMEIDVDMPMFIRSQIAPNSA